METSYLSDAEHHELILRAVTLVLEEQQCSTSFLLRRLKIGWAAAELLNKRLVAHKIVTHPDPTGSQLVRFEYTEIDRVLEAVQDTFSRADHIWSGKQQRNPLTPEQRREHRAAYMRYWRGKTKHDNNRALQVAQENLVALRRELVKHGVVSAAWPLERGGVDWDAAENLLCATVDVLEAYRHSGRKLRGSHAGK